MPYWRLYYHLVWTTDNRLLMITSEIERKVHLAIENKAKALGAEVFGIDGTEDHVHMAAAVPPSISIGKFVGEVKGSSSFHINHLKGNNKEITWQRGYGVVSFRRDNLEQVLEYIRNQKEHHASGKIWRSLEECNDDENWDPTLVKESAADYLAINDQAISFKAP